MRVHLNDIYTFMKLVQGLLTIVSSIFIIRIYLTHEKKTMIMYFRRIKYKIMYLTT